MDIKKFKMKTNRTQNQAKEDRTSKSKADLKPFPSYAGYRLPKELSEDFPQQVSKAHGFYGQGFQTLQNLNLNELTGFVRSSHFLKIMIKSF